MVVRNGIKQMIRKDCARLPSVGRRRTARGSLREGGGFGISFLKSLFPSLGISFLSYLAYPSSNLSFHIGNILSQITTSFIGHILPFILGISFLSHWEYPSSNHHFNTFSFIGHCLSHKKGFLDFFGKYSYFHHSVGNGIMIKQR